VATDGKAMRRDYDLCRQMRRAAVSVMSNISEGHERANRGEYSQSLSVAKGSCGEVRAQLYIAQDIGALEPDAARALIAQAEEVSRLIAGLRKWVESQRRQPSPADAAAR
jgi:four helix bundle protein